MNSSDSTASARHTGMPLTEAALVDAGITVRTVTRASAQAVLDETLDRILDRIERCFETGEPLALEPEHVAVAALLFRVAHLDLDTLSAGRMSERDWAQLTEAFRLAAGT